MMKLILVMAFVALAFPREGECLTCYNCKSRSEPLSTISRFNYLQLCYDKMEDSPKETSPNIDFPECAIIKEKVKVDSKEEIIIIRTFLQKSHNINLNSSNFEVYTCKEDLCNSASVIRDVAVGVFLTVAVGLALTF